MWRSSDGRPRANCAPHARHISGSERITMAKTGHVERLATIRQSIVEVRAEAQRVARARIPLAEAIARIPPFVDEIAMRWTPVVAALSAPEAPTTDSIVETATADVWTLTGMLATAA